MERRRWRRTGWLAAAVLAVAAAMPAEAMAEEPRPAEHSFDPTPLAGPVSPVPERALSPCGQGSWLAGSVEVCAGEVVYRDYVYDDFGSSQTPGPPPESPFPESFKPASFPRFDAYGGLPPAGVQQSGLPDDEQNLHDLVALRLRRAGDAVEVDAELNSLFDPATTRVLLAVDLDPDGGTGGGAWPGLVANPDLSVPLTSEGWDSIVELGEGDATTNTYSGSFPLPPGPNVRLRAVTARADGTVMNVAFRGTDETGFWWDADQATALAGGSIDAFALDLAVADLDPSTTRRATTPRGEVLQRVYVSEHPVGEGVSRAGVPGPAVSSEGSGPAAGADQAFTLLGRYQPYGFVLPTTPGPHGAQLMMHGLAENHSARLYFPSSDESIVANLAEPENRLLVSPTARGWRGWYSGHSARDAFDAFADAVANHDVDRERWFVSGYSMGGYGTMRLGTLYPDLWAGAINWVGYGGDFFLGTPFEGQGGAVGSFGISRDHMGSLRHVPMAAVYASADELVPISAGLEIRRTLADDGVPSQHWVVVGEHVTPMLVDDWRKESAFTSGLTLVEQPAVVTYTTQDRFRLADLGLVPDHAYWVWQVDAAREGDATVDARSFGCGTPVPVVEVREELLDPSPPLPDAMNSQVVEVVDEERAPAQNRVELTLANVASLAIDGRSGMHGACLAADEVLAYRIATDGPSRVRFSDGRVLTMPEAGVYEGEMATAADVEAGGPSDRPTHPATGRTRSPVSALPVAVVGLGLAVLSRRTQAR